MSWHLIEIHPDILIAVVLTLFALYPVLFHLLRGWNIRKEDIFSSLSGDAKRLYLEVFLGLSDVDNPEEAFLEFYFRRYGRRNYIVPTIILFAVLAPLCYLMAETAIPQLVLVAPGHIAKMSAVETVLAPFVTLPDIASAAIIGAYLWIVGDLVDDASQFNLAPSDIQRATLRLIVAAPLGYAIGSLAALAVAPFVAFSVGAFPLEQIGVILRKLTNRQLKIDSSDGGERTQIFELEGVDDSIAERMRGAGITTIAQLAYCDPVQLCMRTGLSFDFLLDLVCQGLAWVYFGEKLARLRPAGLRGSIEVANLYDAYVNGEAGTMIAEASKLITIDDALFLNACSEIAGDPATTFLMEVWDTGKMPAKKGQQKSQHTHGRATRLSPAP